VSGYPDGSFRPDGPITRAEFAAILVKALNLELHHQPVFSDVANHWSGNYVATAAAHGIITGYIDNRFGPDDPITREQMAVMIVRAVNLAGSSDSLVFADQAKISEWAREAVAAAAEQKIMNGYPDNTFRPQETGDTRRGSCHDRECLGQLVDPVQAFIRMVAYRNDAERKDEGRPQQIGIRR